ncbi:MAG: UDP-N-acetylglucosamine 1-carboxyvinyltransferase [Alphaproteobacteria bacterium]|jgi:UDP-N-acetylglucosamine 1-carboxyvinyltransferase|nr:UDP-N-acetylglucosamine 1-carboxyvinyltransferase [Alphaproteobacteria bacterium]
MDSLKIQGGVPLIGEIAISGAKNAALPLLACGLMAGTGSLRLGNVPDLADTRLMKALVRHLGVEWSEDGEDIILSGEAQSYVAPYDLVSQMRASILVMGPLLARYGEAQVSLPGGCAIGTRPVDLHIRAMQKMGAIVELADGYVQARAPKGLSGAKIEFPLVSVGATENALMAACLAKGQTQLVNAAKEPEIIDLAACLVSMGAKIEGAGSDVITIEGVDSLHNGAHSVVPDRVEAGSYAIAAAMTGGALTLTNMHSSHLESLFEAMRQAGVSINTQENTAQISSDGRYQAVDIETQPHPGFPTDLQAQFMAMMCLAEGRSKISETIFENRFMHVPELMRMGADITIEGRTALVTGKASLLSAPVMATDLRASVCLVLAGLATKGETEVSRIYHLDRGYADLESKLGACGAKLVRVAN